MNDSPLWPQRVFDLIEWLKGFRYIKFGLVGASGTVVNIVVLYLAQEHLFAAIADTRQRLYASLAMAICVATVNNFTWNRLWTWADRVAAAHAHHQHLNTTPWQVLVGQFGRYTLASWLGIGLQYGLTLWLSISLHYLLANVIAIVVASVSNFLANDRWTFRHGKPR
jgi:dolichol-phosphate mannosyltransferase